MSLLKTRFVALEGRRRARHHRYLRKSAEKLLSFAHEAVSLVVSCLATTEKFCAAVSSRVDAEGDHAAAACV